MIYEEPIAPTVEAIDAWMAQEKTNKSEGAYYATEYDHYGVNIYTKASQARCITSKTHDMQGNPWYYTIKGEGSSNGCRSYPIRGDRIVRAVGIIVGDRDPRFNKATS